MNTNYSVTPWGLRREIDRLFDGFWSHETSPGWQPACDVEEAEGHFLLTLELPGVPKDQIKVEAHENRLIVTGERRRESEKEAEGAYYSERRFGQFQRVFTLPAGVDAGKIEADYRDGMLRLYVPKAEAAKPKQIAVGGGEAREGGFFSRLIGQKSA